MNNYTHGHIVPLCGGSALGIEKLLGSKPDWIASWSNFSLNESYYRRYRPNVPFYDLDEIENHRGLPYVDIVTAVPPCAGMSAGNLGGLRIYEADGTSYQRQGANSPGANAPSNRYMEYVVNIAMTHVRPKVIVIENSPLVFGKNGIPLVENFKKLAEEKSYSLQLVKTNTIYHGLPQKRPRTFILLWRGSRTPHLKKIRKEYTPFYQYIKNAPVNGLWTNKKHHSPMEDKIFKATMDLSYPDNYQSFIRNISNGTYGTVLRYLQKDDDLLDEVIKLLDNRSAERESRFLNRMKEKRASGYGVVDITTRVPWDYTNTLFWQSVKDTAHPYEPRYLYTSEVAYLMGMPVDYPNVPQEDHNILCQNVPVHTVCALGEEILSALDGKREMLDGFTRMNNALKTDSVFMSPIPPFPEESLEYVQHPIDMT